MSKHRVAWKKTLVLLTVGGSVLSLGACPYSKFADYVTLLSTSGSAAIGVVSADVFGANGLNVDDNVNKVVVQPTTAFVQSLWKNFVTQLFPSDIPSPTQLKT